MSDERPMRLDVQGYISPRAGINAALSKCFGEVDASDSWYRSALKVWIDKETYV